MYESGRNKNSVRQTYCTLLLINLAILGCLFIYGCLPGQAPEKTSQAPEWQHPPSGNLEAIHSYLADLPVLEPSIMTVLTTNPVTVKTESIHYWPALSKEAILIGGLIDQGVEDTINNRLAETYTRLEEGTIPPYRGIYQLIPRGTPVAQVEIFAHPTFNFEQILSVTVNGNLMYDLAAEERQDDAADAGQGSDPYLLEPVSAGVIECLNFDLKSGREILLPELFADPQSAMKLINDAVADILVNESYDPEGYYYSAPIPASPFKGLEVNQKYYLTEFGIYLVIDYLNPGFDVIYYPAQIYLPFTLFDGKLALDERFAADASMLYTEPGRTGYQLVYRDARPGSNPVSYTEIEQSGDIEIYINTHHPDRLPDSIMERIIEAKEEVNNVVAGIKTHPPAADSSGEVNRYYEYTLVVNCKGPYYTLRESIFSHGLEPDFFQIYYQAYTEEGIPLKLEDCFKAGYDYQKEIYSAYLEQHAVLGPEPPVSIEQLFEQISFNLESTGLEFILSGQQVYNTYFIHYQEFGFENLAIF